MNEHQSSKLSEIELLSSISGASYKPLKQPTDQLILDEKLKLVSLIKENCVKEIKFPVTNWSSRTTKLFDHELYYRYLREGVSFVNKPASEVFYPFNQFEHFKTEHMFGRFCTNAQGPMSALIQTLKLAYGSLNFLNSNSDIYFETQFVFDCHENLESAQNHPLKILLIDSIATSLDQYNETNIQEADVVIFDTTCFEHGSKNIDHFARLSKEKPLFLLRSSLKLDSLGVEYAHLGSILGLNLEKLPKYEKKTSIQKDFPSFVNLLNSQLAMMGSNAPLESYYPFYWNPKFKELNSTRIERIRENTKSVKSELLEKYSNIKTFNYNLFLKIPIKEKKENLTEIVAKVRELTGVPIYAAFSFGFDFISVDQFRVSNDRDKNELRITGYDLPFTSQKVIQKALSMLLKNFDLI